MKYSFSLKSKGKPAIFGAVLLIGGCLALVSGCRGAAPSGLTPPGTTSSIGRIQVEEIAGGRHLLTVEFLPGTLPTEPIVAWARSDGGPTERVGELRFAPSNAPPRGPTGWLTVELAETPARVYLTTQSNPELVLAEGQLLE